MLPLTLKFSRRPAINNLMWTTHFSQTYYTQVFWKYSGYLPTHIHTCIELFTCIYRVYNIYLGNAMLFVSLFFFLLWTLAEIGCILKPFWPCSSYDEVVIAYAYKYLRNGYEICKKFSLTIRDDLFKKCAITHALDGTEHNILWGEKNNLN